MANRTKFNLTASNFASDTFNASGDRASVQINATAWGAAIVELQWALTDVEDGPTWLSFAPPIKFNSKRTGIVHANIAGVELLRLQVTTNDGAADSNATLLFTIGRDTTPLEPDVTARVIGQLTPADTNAATLVSGPARIDIVRVQNTSGTNRTYQIYIDNDGSTYDSTTEIENNNALLSPNPPKDVFLDHAPFVLEAGGTIGVESSIANDITFTAFGLQL